MRACTEGNVLAELLELLQLEQIEENTACPFAALPVTVVPVPVPVPVLVVGVGQPAPTTSAVLRSRERAYISPPRSTKEIAKSTRLTITALAEYACEKVPPAGGRE